ncbi:MAG: hypothetical protein IPK85_04705 [Gemmatimonadetes bacterium]|nr:hypothetical protein [Gemmatimonadota bacterium]
MGWSYSPNVENDAVSTSGGGIGGPGGYRHLVMLGGSVVLSRAVMDRGHWYVLAGAARIDGWGFEGIRPLRHTVASHLGIGWRPTPAFPRLLAEVRARYAPVWRNAPVRYVSGVLVWAL